MPQPYLVPVIFNSSRNTQSNGVLGSAVTSFCWPFTVSLYVSICEPHALLLWAGHAGFDPAAGSLHELRMRQWRAAVRAGILSSHQDVRGQLVDDDPRRFGFHNLRH